MGDTLPDFKLRPQCRPRRYDRLHVREQKTPLSCGLLALAELTGAFALQRRGEQMGQGSPCTLAHIR